ncbi:MAG: deoxyribonuclease IV [Phycisphaerales bacterium]|jgi:deoxyribonuclease-4|nr:deoxyribonuclease IV [Phycisphaerales bacterium]
MFGSHLSIAGSMLTALDEAQRLCFDTVQVFTKNQQQWAAKPLDPAMVRDWNARVAILGWGDRMVSHASYLINLATHQDELWRKSIDLMTDEIERCETLGIRYLVHHPGSFVGHTLDAGLTRIADAYRELFNRTRGYQTVSCLEDTAGGGSTIGGPFEDLARLRSIIIDKTGEPPRIAYCLDSCHMHAFGHDLSTREAAEKALDHFHATCGIENLRVFHLNDSKGIVGSRLDRHAHIGEGTIGAPNLAASGFAAIVNHPVVARVPKILETPKENRADGVPWDIVNRARLVSLQSGGDPEALVGEWTASHPVAAAQVATPKSSKPKPAKTARTPKPVKSEVEAKPSTKPANRPSKRTKAAPARTSTTRGKNPAPSAGDSSKSSRPASRSSPKPAKSPRTSGARKIDSSRRATRRG